MGSRVPCRYVTSATRTLPWVLLLLAPLVRADTPVLHEYVPGAGDDELSELVQGRGSEPAALVYRGEIIPPPDGGPRRPGEEPMRAQPGDGEGREEPGRRSPAFRPDRVTALEGTLGYATVFSPTIAPFKRVTALDAVVEGEDGTPVLGVADPRTRPVPLVGANAPSDEPRDRFWGSVVLDFASGRRVPLPSVAPESRVLTLRTEPEAQVRVEKDAADNFFAVLEAGPRREVRATFLMDAPQRYFGMELPEVTSDALASEVFELPEATRRDALAFAAELGLHPGDDLRTVLETLTRHFRAFVESDEPPPSSGRIYLDLARGMKGVCRHRAYAFVITAQALGVPTRFVQNEAHAWVEAKIVGNGWLRIDLGGAASALEAHGGEDRPVYRPAHPDPLPRPPAYRDSYSQLRGDVRGLRTGEGDGGEVLASGVDAPPAAAEARTTRRTPAALDQLLGEPSTSEEPRARPVRLRLDRERYDVYRGRRLVVTGRATDPDEQGAEGLRVEVLLRDERERLLGVTVTEAGGLFRAAVGVPPDLPVGDYRLIVRTPGDERYLPATAR